MERATFVLAVLGEFSSGKSFLLNALLGQFRFEQGSEREQIAGLLATDINPSTATITELEYATENDAYAYHAGGRVERIPIDRLSRFVAVDESAPSRVVVKIDSAFLQRGFTVADTPGLASVNPAHRRATLQFLPGADAVLYLIDTQQPFSEGDAAFLGMIRRHLDTIFIVQTKIDLWEQNENGKAAWEHAHERIAQLAAVHAPGTYVYALSARQYIKGILRDDAALVERSRFPQFLAALDASLVKNTGRERLKRAARAARGAGLDTVARLERDLGMFAKTPDELRRLRDAAAPVVASLQAFVRISHDAISAAAERLAQALLERGRTLADEAVRGIAHMFDTADIARLRDGARLHVLVDRTLGEVVQTFADEAAIAVASEYGRRLAPIAERLPIRFSFADTAAEAFGSSGSSSLWSEDPAHALAAAIVLDAIGGPAIELVQAVTARFASSPPGAYMKRELTADLRLTVFPIFRNDLAEFVTELTLKVGRIASALTSALESAMVQARDSELGSVERALALHEDEQNIGDEIDRRRGSTRDIKAAVATIDRIVDAFLLHGEEIAAADPGAEAVRRAHVEAAFDREAYNRGLRPQRWRVTVLGALRRGKSSLINAFAGRRVLADEVSGEIAYPVHVRYGEEEGAFALQPDGSWLEIEIESAPEEATRNPVLILTPWKLPHELVLVHAPAFDSGGATGEDVSMVAARAASEVLCLFSRQLSDRELALYERVAETGKPMMFAHTLADNESRSERQHVVELAQQYLRERNIPVQRIFTVSTLEYSRSRRERRAPAAWNELDALISTIEAHAEEHMARLARLERAARRSEPVEQAGAVKSRGLFSRLFSK